MEKESEKDPNVQEKGKKRVYSFTEDVLTESCWEFLPLPKSLAWQVKISGIEDRDYAGSGDL